MGTKADIREDKSAVAKLKDQGTEIVSKEMAEQVAKAIKAVKYMECSAMKNNGVKEVFEEALYNGLYPPEVKTEKKKNSCLIL